MLTEKPSLLQREQFYVHRTNDNSAKKKGALLYRETDRQKVIMCNIQTNKTKVNNREGKFVKKSKRAYSVQSKGEIIT